MKEYFVVDKIPTNASVGFFSSIIGFFLGWWGSKIKLKELEERIDELAHTVRFIDSCDERSEGIKARLDSIEKMNKEMRDDIKLLLRGQNSGN